MKNTLNAGQEKAKTQLIKFLASRHKYFCLDAAAGYGKTYLLSYVQSCKEEINNLRTIKQLKEIHQFKWCASTNKAASLLHGGTTVFKAFGFNLFKDFSTGNMKVSDKKATPLVDTVLFIDESSMLEHRLLELIDKHTHNCKVIFVGDSYQLAPIGSRNIPAFNNDYPKAELTEPMRQDKDSHLFKTCQGLRQAVISHKWFNIQQGEGITFLNQQDFKQGIVQAATNMLDFKIITYTNARSIGFNDYVRKAMKLPSHFIVGDTVITRNYALDVTGNTSVGPEYIGKITDEGSSDIYQDVACRTLNLDGTPFRVADNVDEVKVLIKSAKDSADWSTFFDLQESFLDLRAGYAITGHSSQGSTFDTVFLDMSDMLKCTNPDTLLRLVYVAVSRAKSNVFIYGL